MVVFAAIMLFCTALILVAVVVVTVVACVSSIVHAVKDK